MNEKNLKQLVAKWDRVLAKSGFRDIEDRSTGLLRKWSGSPLNTDMENQLTSIKGYESKLYKESRAEYYRLASHKLHTERFPNTRAKAMWEMHCNGMVPSEIVKRLRRYNRGNRKKYQLTINQVKARIDNMRKVFGL